MKLCEFVHALIQCSEKAAHLAWLIRAEKSLFALLVEEKTGDAKNKRFVQDFKTLADVLVQETIKHDLGKQVKKGCPGDTVLILFYCGEISVRFWRVLNLFDDRNDNSLRSNSGRICRQKFKSNLMLNKNFPGAIVNYLSFMWLCLKEFPTDDSKGSTRMNFNVLLTRPIFVCQFAGIENHIYGEESNEFTNTLGETVLVSIQASAKETAQLLGSYPSYCSDPSGHFNGKRLSSREDKVKVW